MRRRRIRTLRPGRGEAQPQQGRKERALETPSLIRSGDPLRLVLRTQPRSGMGQCREAAVEMDYSP